MLYDYNTGTSQFTLLMWDTQKNAKSKNCGNRGYFSSTKGEENKIEL